MCGYMPSIKDEFARKGDHLFPCENIQGCGLMRYRFGLFEFDDSELVLRREQAIMRLQSQPARVLACLINNRERVVSREELRRCLWGDSTFVDFNGGLNFCIAQVRSALGDDPSNPRYIRTIPKLGYQFIAPRGSSRGFCRQWRPLIKA
jgi:DNA-binding winged helix-turn-helix (wHTH) protein